VTVTGQILLAVHTIAAACAVALTPNRRNRSTENAWSRPRACFRLGVRWRRSMVRPCRGPGAI